MGTQKVILEKTGGKRLSLYAELGRYFAADGSFDQQAFRGVLQEALQGIAQRFPQPEEYQRESKVWLKDYLGRVMDYLEEKDMEEAAAAVFMTSIDECARRGLDEVMVSSRHLNRVLASLPGQAPVKREKRAALDEKRRKIFDAAIEVFAEQGYHKAKIEEIAALSGVAKGTVYMYFQSKEDLLNQLLEEHFHDIVGHINAICSRDTHVLQQIREMIEFWVHFVASHHTLYRLIQSEAIFQRTSNKTMFYDYIVSHLPMFKERIVALNQEQKLKTTSFYTTFYGILGFIDGVVNKWFRCGMDYPLEDEIPVILEVLFNGFVGQEINPAKLP